MSNVNPGEQPPVNYPATPQFPQNPNPQYAPQPPVYGQHQPPVVYPGQPQQYAQPQYPQQYAPQPGQAPLFPNGVAGSQFQPNHQLAARTGRNWVFAIAVTVVPIIITGIIILVMVGNYFASY